MSRLHFVGSARPPQRQISIPEFVPHRGLWPLGQFITDSIGTQQMPLSKLAERMGYAKIKFGIAEITRAVFKNKFTPEFVTNLGVGLGVAQPEVDRVISANTLAVENEQIRRQQWEESRARACFLPFLHVRHERNCPSPIFPLDYSSWRFVPVPEEICQRPWREQISAVGDLIREHYGSTKGTPFGRIKRYSYWPSLDEGFEFGTDGIPKFVI